jgi:hypothetical protein
VTGTQLSRRILAAVVVVVLPPLLMLTVIGWAGESVKGDVGSALAFAAVLVPMWLLWFATIVWIVRAGWPNTARRLGRNPDQPQ